jgi:predicted Fe-Mo cluster-binding NifX family protein
MKVAISATGPSLDAAVDPRFGRCPCFVLVDTDDMSVSSVENGSGALGGGAGIQSAQLVAQQGARAVLTGSCGPNAHQTLSAAGIQVFTGCAGSVTQVVERYKKGEFTATAEPNAQSHAGMGGGRRR